MRVLVQNLPAETATAAIEVRALETDEVLAQATLDLPAQSEFLFQALPGSSVRLMVNAFDAQGNRLGLSDQEVALNGSTVEVTVSELALVGQTREIGLISQNQAGANGASSQPALSSDGNFVAFASAATNLVPGTPPPTGTVRIFRKNRATGEVKVVSSGPLDSEPDISGDGRFVVYAQQDGGVFLRDLVQPRGARFFIPKAVTVGTNTINFVLGDEPRISEDGSLVILRGSSGGSPNQILLFDVVTATGTLITRTSTDTQSGNFSHPSITPDAGQIFFSSSGNDRVPAGVVVFNRATGQFARLLDQPSAFACAVSRDGNLVAVHSQDHRLLLLDRAAGTTTEIPRPNSFAAVGAPSLSADGRFLTFASSRSDLVSNDGNARTDVFVLDRVTGVISRVNLSNDQMAVEGGVVTDTGSPAVPARDGPVVARNGSRIAFASNDSLLVRSDNNAATDVFTTIVPTPGKLYVANEGNAILRFDDVVTIRNGLPVPTAVITSAAFEPRVKQVVLDVANDRLYVLSGDFLGTSKVHQLERASTLNGSVTPARTLQFISDGTLFLLNATRDELITSHSTFGPASTLGTTSGFLLAGGELSAAVLSERFRDIIFVGKLSSLAIHDFGRTTTTLLGRPVGLALDLSPAGTPGRNNANLIALSLPRAEDGLTTNSLARYAGNLDAAPGLQQLVIGANAVLDQPGTLGPLLVDHFTGDIYASVGKRINVFPTGADGNVVPARGIRFNGDLTSFALDRTR